MAVQSEEPESSPEVSETPVPSPSATPVKTESIRITKEENRKKLQVLLSGTEASLPDKTPDRIFEATLVSSDAYGSDETLSIRIYGDEVYYLSTVNGKSTGFSAKCSPSELQKLITAVREDEGVSVSPDPSASATPAPASTTDPYLATPAPAAPAQK